jgi:nitrite reductase (NADH) large subunit
LLAADLDEETAIKYIDRFLLYYIQTADRLTRTSVWLEKMEGGIEYLRDVIINDRLGICEELEKQMQFLVDTYRCEWKEVVDDPEKRRLFQQFANTDETESSIEFVTERGQQRPSDWPKDFVPLEQLARCDGRTPGEPRHDRPTRWVKVGKVSDFPVDGGGAIRYGNSQIAVFRFASRDAWYACQNLCPHKKEMVLSRGILGDQGGVPKVACPLHKKTFSLESGTCLSGEKYQVQVFPVKVEADAVYLDLPAEADLEELLRPRTPCVAQCV